MTPSALLDLPGRDEARAAARHELSRHAYAAARPPWYERLLGWLLARLDDLVARASDAVPGGGWGVLALVLLFGLLVTVVLVRLRPTARRTAPSVFGMGGVLTAQQHRHLAEEAAAVGDFAAAVRERLRAVVRELEERGVLDPRPGRTADEVAREAGRAQPDLAIGLTQGTRLFDDVWYGGHPADASTYAVLVQLDAQVRASRLTMA